LTPDESATVPGALPAVAATGSAAERPLTLAESVVLSYGALFFPWVAHRASGRVQPLRFIPADGVAAGQLARTALERGAWIAAAHQALTAVLAAEPPIRAAQIDALLRLQVNVIARTAPGFVLLDDQTLGRESDTRPTSVRRLLILLKRLALREGAGLVFEPNDVDLQERVLTDFERLLSALHQRGALAGTTPEEAYQVVADATVNPPQSVDRGRFVVELRVAPSQPLKFLRVRLVQSGPQQIAVGEA
jgi:phage tail sheath protein FI